jgi:hypothetical protein
MIYPHFLYLIVIEVAVNVEVLEIVLEIRRDGSGQPRLIIRQDVKVPDPLPELRKKVP